MKLFRIFALLLALCSPTMATVSSTINTITYTGNSATTNFSFNFSYPGAASSAASDFTVTIVVSGVTTILPTNSYTITFNAPVSPNPTGIGGSVLYPLIGSPLATGATITITRTLPAIQTVSLSNQGILYPPTLEAEYDYLTMLVQQALNEFGRVVIAPITDPSGLNYTLPAAAARAGLLSCFDSSGNVTACSVLPQGTVSSVMQPVVNAATLAAARAALGVSSAATPNCGLQTGVSGVNNLDVNFTTSQVSTNQPITAASCDTVFIATGPITFTLPRANTLWNGFGFWINVVSGGVITVAINANDSIALPGQSLASGVSGTLLVNTWAYVTTDAASSGTWRIALTFADDVLHAKAYGATGNGSTDDTTALQAWINACETLSMKCFLDAGTYKTSSVLTVNAALTIEGVNRNTSIIAPSVATQDGIDVNTNAYVQFSSFAVNSSASPPTAGYCINITGPFQNQGAILRDLAFSCYNSIYMNQAAQWKIDGIFGLAQNIAITVALGGDSTIMNSNINAVVIGILFQPPASAGGLRINNVKMVGASISSGVGIELLLPSAAGPSDLIISNSSIEDFQTGIYLLKNTGTTFVQINILGNEFENQNCIATDANVGWLAAVTITGNICQISGSNTGFALATGTGYDVTGNIFYGGTTGIALASGVGGIFSDNYFVSTTTNYSALSTVAIVKDAEGVAFAGLPSSAANGSQIFCSNCAPASSPCTGSSTGSTALRQNGAWKCF